MHPPPFLQALSHPMPLSRVYIYARWPHKIRETCRHFSPKSCCNLPGTTAWFPSIRSHRSMSPRYRGKCPSLRQRRPRHHQPLRPLDIGPNASLPFRSSSSPHARLLTVHARRQYLHPYSQPMGPFLLNSHLPTLHLPLWI